MADLKDLYQDILLDHYKKPRNKHRPPGTNRQADGLNPLCGDQLVLYLQIENGVICDIGFDGTGCAIAVASASMLTEILMGKTEQEAKAIHDGFIRFLSSPTDPLPDTPSLGNLALFSGLRGYPVRVKCATLAWHTLRAALEQNPERVSTE